MIIGNKEYNMDSHHVYVMGILNVTPDSFSDGGSFCNIDAALKLCVKSVKKKFDSRGQQIHPLTVDLMNELGI